MGEPTWHYGAHEAACGATEDTICPVVADVTCLACLRAAYKQAELDVRRLTEKLSELESIGRQMEGLILNGKHLWSEGRA